MRSRLAVVALGLILTGCGGTEAEIAGVTTSSSSSTTDRAKGSPPATAAPRRVPRHPEPSERPLRKIRALAGKQPHDEQLTEVARGLLPTDVKVWCWNDSDWAEIQRVANSALPREKRTPFAGLADLYSYQIHLGPSVCDPLTEQGLETATELEVADAVLVLAHETRHLSVAGASEHLAECKALQLVARTAELLGLPTPRARRLARIAWEDIYPSVPAQYRSRECRPGGALDEDPDDPAFP